MLYTPGRNIYCRFYLDQNNFDIFSLIKLQLRWVKFDESGELNVQQ